MILNTYAVLLAFIALLRLGLGVLVLGLGAFAWHARRFTQKTVPSLLATPEEREAAEGRIYLVFLLALLILGLNLISWPLLYLLLQSYVPEWPGVMCIYGVMQVGTDSLGPSRFLPDLLRLLQLTKPALVFVGGAWFVIYLLNRRTRTAPLTNRLFVVLLPLGALAAADAVAELAYIGIPKKEVFPTGGCCLGAFDDGAARFTALGFWDDPAQAWLWAGYYGGNLGLILALFVSIWRKPSVLHSFILSLLLLGGVIVLAVSGLFLIDVAAPTLLHLPYHHCPYDLIPEMPEAIVAVIFFIGGTFFLGWACVARWFARSPETEPFLPGAVRGLLQLSLLGYLASLAMLSLELALA